MSGGIQVFQNKLQSKPSNKWVNTDARGFAALAGYPSRSAE